MVDLERELAQRPVARGARELHERVADHPPERAVLVARDRRADVVVGRARQEREVRAAVRAPLVGVDVRPVLLQAGAVAEVLHAGAAHGQQARERRGLGQPGEQVAPARGGALERRAHVRRAEADDVAEPLRPGRGRRTRRSGRRCARRGRPSSARRARARRPRRATPRRAPPAPPRARGRCRRCGGRCCSGRRRACGRGPRAAARRRSGRRRAPTTCPSRTARGRRPRRGRSRRRRGGGPSRARARRGRARSGRPTCR